MAAIGLIHEAQHDPVLQAELKQLTAALQAAINPLGVWIAIADPTLFTGGTSMTWTVEARDQVNLAYTMIGATMLLNIAIDASSVGGTPSGTLQMFLPNGKTAKRTTKAACQIFDNSGATSVLGQIRATKDSKVLSIFRFDLANFTASTDLTSIIGQIAVETY